MIHLNLIDAAERMVSVETVSPVHVTSIDRLNKKSRKKIATVVAAALFAVVAFSCFLSVSGVPEPLQGVLPPKYLSLIGVEDPSRSALTMGVGQRTSAGGALEAQANAAAAAAAAAARQRDAMTAKQVVGEINPQALFNNKRADYNSFLPLEKASYQKSAVGQFVAFLNTATPDDVGFSDCVFEAPNFFYVRGVAAKPTSQRSFLERIKAVSSNFQTPALPENAPATDITAYGIFNVNNPNMASVGGFVPSAEASNEIKSLKALATSAKVQLSGMDKPEIEDFGVYKRYSINATSTADFSDLQAFITAYATSPIRVGVKKIVMEQAKKDLASVIRFEMLVTP